MNAMQYDAMALGEKDLMAAATIVAARFQEAKFPILSANVGPADVLPNIQPYVLRPAGEHTIAIIGVTNPAAAQRSATLGVSLTLSSPVQAVQSVMKEVRSKADVVIVLSNLDQKSNLALAQQVLGIDAILGVYGGQQVKAQTVAGPDGAVLLQAAGPQGQLLGLLVLRFDAQGRIAGFSDQFFVLTSQYADDPAMLAIMQRYGVQP